MGRYGAFNPSYVGLGEVLVSPAMEAHMRAVAERAKDYAEEMSPVGPEGTTSGGKPLDPHRELYKNSWEVESGVQHRKTSRAYGRVTNPVDYAASVEFGNSQQDGQYVLTRAIDAMKE